MIEVRLFATLREGRDKISMLDSNQYKTIGAVLGYFSIPIEEVAIILINGHHAVPDAPVKDGDVLALFPPLGGG